MGQMNLDAAQAQFQKFFGLRTAGELREFLQTENAENPYVGALLRYAQTWNAATQGDDAGVFNPTSHLSEDLSAGLIGETPCIFLGTNDWSVRVSGSQEYLRERTLRFQKQILRMRGLAGKSQVVVVVVPEKDYLIDRLFRKSGRYAAISAEMNFLAEQFRAASIPFVFHNAIDGLEKYQSESDFSYPDSHLPGRNYVHIFATMLVALGFDWGQVQDCVSLTPFPQYMDLVGKLSGVPENPNSMAEPDVTGSDVALVGGNEALQSPLGATWQRYRNATPRIDKSVLLLGDSHSSILRNRKLNYLCSNIFSETEFHWDPCGVRGSDLIYDSDVVILEISQRFIF